MPGPLTPPILINQVDSAAPRPLLGIMLRLGAIVALGIMFALVKLAGDHGVHVVESLFWRQLAGLPVVVLWLWWSGKLADIRTRRPGAHALRTGLGLCAMALNFLAMLMLPMAQATTISFATPIFATLLAALLLGEPTGRYRWGAIFLGFAGILVVIRPDGIAAPDPGLWVALAGASLTAGVLIQLRNMSRQESAGAIVFWFSLTSLVPLGIGMLFVARSHDAQSWSIVAGLALAGAVAQLLLTSAMRHASVAAVSTMDYTGIIWSVLFGMVIFGEPLDSGIWLGAPIVIAAGMIIIWRERHMSRQTINSA